MLYDGERLRIPSTNEWSQNMGEMLLIPGNNNSENNNTNNNNNNNKKNASTATRNSNSNSGTSTNNNMIHAAAAVPPAARVMDKPVQDQQAAALKCPRCDSSNTKFCYYNNYSLSQPRHFCKACKRYWTRGGTLRNVPVGGGCRKNKRVKKPTSAAAAAAAAASDPLPSPHMPPTNSIPSISLPNPTSHLDPSMNPLFYSLPTVSSSSSSSSSDLGLAFSGLRTSSVQHSISIPCTGFDSLGLGFPLSQSQRDDEFHLSQLQTPVSVMNDYPFFGSTAASLLLSSLKQPRKLEDCQTLMPYEDLQAEGNGNLEAIKEVKLEGDGNAINNSRIEWQIPFDNSFDAILPATSTSLAGDSSFLYWNSAVGAWPDSANCGSSVAPLI